MTTVYTGVPNKFQAQEMDDLLTVQPGQPLVGGQVFRRRGPTDRSLFTGTDLSGAELPGSTFPPQAAARR